MLDQGYCTSHNSIHSKSNSHIHSHTLSLNIINMTTGSFIHRHMHTYIMLLHHPSGAIAVSHSIFCMIVTVLPPLAPLSTLSKRKIQDGRDISGLYIHRWRLYICARTCVISEALSVYHILVLYIWRVRIYSEQETQVVRGCGCSTTFKYLDGTVLRLQRRPQ